MPRCSSGHCKDMLDWKVTICVSCVPAIIIYFIDFIVVTLLPRDLARNIPSAITLCHRVSPGQPRNDEWKAFELV